MTEAADSYGTQHRRTVEEEARRLLADAEAKAKEQLDHQAKSDDLERTSSSATRLSSGKRRCSKSASSGFSTASVTWLRRSKKRLLSRRIPETEDLVDALDVERRS